jgi:hypothetical protein
VRSGFPLRGVGRGLNAVLLGALVLALLGLGAYLLPVVRGAQSSAATPSGDETARPLPPATPEARRNAAAILVRMGELVSSQDVTPAGQGDFVYVRTMQVDLGKISKHEVWYDPHGMIALRMKVRGVNSRGPIRRDRNRPMRR